MKHITCISILALFVALLLLASMAPVSAATTWLTYRDDIAISSGNADIDATFWYNGTGATNVSVNFTLPCNVLNLSGTETNFTVGQTSSTDWNATFNLTVNGVAVNSSSIFNNTGTNNMSTLTQMIAAGVTNTDEYLNFTFNCSVATNTVIINITGTNVNLTTTWIPSVITIKEKDVTSPTVGKSSTKSYFTVNNSMNITSDLWFSLTDVVLNTTFPASTITDSITNFTITTLANNGTNQQYTQYQKRGPYVWKVKLDNGEVDIWLKTPESLTNCVTWVLDPSDEDTYEDDGVIVFRGLGSDDSLTIDHTVKGELDEGDDEDDPEDWYWDEDEETIIFEEFTVYAEWTNNKFTFEWTEAVVVVPPVEPVVPIYLQSLAGIPVLVLIGIIAIVAVIVVVAAKGKKK